MPLAPADTPWCDTASQPSPRGYDNLPPQVDGVLVNILAVMCGSQRRNESSGFQRQLSVYLHSKGVKRRQIEALHRLGLCCSYHKTLQVIKRQSEAAAEAVTLRGEQPTAVTAYDNFEQMKHVKASDNASSGPRRTAESACSS